MDEQLKTDAGSGSLERVVRPPSPWEEGYMAGQARSGSRDEARQYRELANRDEFLRGFDAGRDDASQRC